MFNPKAPDEATARIKGTDRTYTAEEIAEGIVNNKVGVYSATIAQYEVVARAYLELLDRVGERTRPEPAPPVDWVEKSGWPWFDADGTPRKPAPITSAADS